MKVEHRSDEEDWKLLNHVVELAEEGLPVPDLAKGAVIEFIVELQHDEDNHRDIDETMSDIVEQSWLLDYEEAMR